MYSSQERIYTSRGDDAQAREIERLRKRNSELEDLLAQAHSQLRERDADMSKSRMELQQKDSELHRLRVEAQSTKGSLSRQEEEMSVVQRRLSEQLSESKAQLAESHAKCNAVESEVRFSRAPPPAPLRAWNCRCTGVSGWCAAQATEMMCVRRLPQLAGIKLRVKELEQGLSTGRQQSESRETQLGEALRAAETQADKLQQELEVARRRLKQLEEEGGEGRAHLQEVMRRADADAAELQRKLQLERDTSIRRDEERQQAEQACPAPAAPFAGVRAGVLGSAEAAPLDLTALAAVPSAGGGAHAGRSRAHQGGGAAVARRRSAGPGTNFRVAESAQPGKA